MSPRAWGILLVLCGAVFLEGIDIAMLNVALPSIRADLGLSTGSLQWVMSAYVLGYGGFMLLGGRAADLFGRRRMFLAPLAVFLVFSGLGGFATEGWVLVLARFVTGVCAAFMTPAGLSVITTGFPEGPQRNKALLIYSGTGGGGFSAGLIVGGLLTSVDWRWAFFAPVALSAVILAFGLPLIPRPREARPARGGVDLPGALTVTGAILLLALTVERAGHAPALQTLGALAVSLALFAAFVAIERRSAAPLVRLGILRTGSLLRANLVALLFTAGFFGFQFVAVLYLRELRGWSTLQTSFALLAVGVDAVLAPTVTPRLVQRFGNARVILGGLSLAAVAYALFLPVGADWTYPAMFPSMFLLGLSFALAYGPLTIVATDGVKEDEQGLAGGLLYTSFQFGAALGLASVTAVATGVIGDGGVGGAGGAGDGRSAGEILAGYRAALLVPLGTSLLGLVIGALGLRGRRNRLDGNDGSDGSDGTNGADGADATDGVVAVGGTAQATVTADPASARTSALAQPSNRA
ncbi:MFS transporter [Streptomyces sp. MST-110588]|uniref:MFS transporter n=1 Tax=Streptomyces sp. MST-110588 TaxID=2833628 RepID=UPI001F5C337E|nr:MFS transporter [Streptomyces sp. MST-110588]UNO43747.1 MFS transporter [Streptomyces sp. MST-110588]